MKIKKEIKWCIEKMPIIFLKKTMKKHNSKGVGVAPIKVVGYYNVGNQIISMKKWSDLQLALQLSFELQWPFVVHYNSMYFYGCECYWTSCMSYKQMQFIVCETICVYNSCNLVTIM